MTLGVCIRCGSHNFSLELVPIASLPKDPSAECNDCKSTFVLFPQQHHAPCPRCKGVGEVVRSTRIESFSNMDDLSYAANCSIVSRCSLCRGRQWVRT